MTVVRDDDLHPPDDLRLFPMPEPGILRLDDCAFVAVVRYGDIVVWHYAFADHWFKINATTDREGRLVETSAPEEVPPFTFNCDIASPMRRHGDAVFAVDMFLDVLVRSDGVTFGVYDQREFDHAVRQGWVSQREAKGARDGLAGYWASSKQAVWWRCSATPIPSGQSLRLRHRPCRRFRWVRFRSSSRARARGGEGPPCGRRHDRYMCPRARRHPVMTGQRAVPPCRPLGPRQAACHLAR
jgi:hypothetical protein